MSKCHYLLKNVAISPLLYTQGACVATVRETLESIGVKINDSKRIGINDWVSTRNTGLYWIEFSVDKEISQQIEKQTIGAEEDKLMAMNILNFGSKTHMYVSLKSLRNMEPPVKNVRNKINGSTTSSGMILNPDPLIRYSETSNQVKQEPNDGMNTEKAIPNVLSSQKKKQEVVEPVENSVEIPVQSTSQETKWLHFEEKLNWEFRIENFVCSNEMNPEVIVSDFIVNKLGFFEGLPFHVISHSFCSNHFKNRVNFAVSEETRKKLDDWKTKKKLQETNFELFGKKGTSHIRLVRSNTTSRSVLPLMLSLIRQFLLNEQKDIIIHCKKNSLEIESKIRPTVFLSLNDLKQKYKKEYNMALDCISKEKQDELRLLEKDSRVSKKRTLPNCGSKEEPPTKSSSLTYNWMSNKL